MNNTTNKQYWDKVNIDYKKAWETPSQRWMSIQELNFIEKYLPKAKGNNVLDIGVGIGRIISFFDNNKKVQSINGIDISEEMIKISKEVLKDSKKLKEIKLCDLSQEEVPFNQTFDLISAIRILKYNKNWKENIVELSKKLSKNGALIFTVSNTYSLNIFAKTDNTFYRSNKNELESFLKENNLKLLEIRTFTRIPDFFYTLSKNMIYSNLLVSIEKFLSLILGKYVGGRILFISAARYN